MARHMGLKFLLLQIVLITFGIALYFALATFKKNRETKKELADSKNVQEEIVECNFDHWIGSIINKDAARETGRPVRILEPNSMATMDYIPERINIHTDSNGVVIKVICG
jgi:hypothetical protein